MSGQRERAGTDRRLQGAARLVEASFVAREVVSALPELAGRALGQDWAAAVVRADRRGWLTLRYDLDHVGPVYGFVRPGGTGARSFEAQRYLWTHGFGDGARYRVPEPLMRVPREHLSLIRGARGTSLGQILLRGSTDAALEGVRMAARWLAVLHATSLPGAEVEPASDRLHVLGLGIELARAAAAAPGHGGMLLELLQRLRCLAALHTPPPALVPAHGQYSPAAVFLDGLDVTVTDLDRLSLSDPARDVAGFMQQAKRIAGKVCGEAARGEAVAQAFLEEYARHEPQHLENLGYYGAWYALKQYMACFRRGKTDPATSALARYYLCEFERWCAAPGGARDAQPAPLDQAHLGSAVPKSGREELGRWVLETATTDFITRYVSPRLPGAAQAAERPLACEMTVAQDTGTGRLTLRYAFAQGDVIFAKLYTDALGTHSYQLQRALWERGFGPGAPYQVPEPLAFLPEHNLVLMRGAAGTPLGSLLASPDRTALLEGVRQAARWLAALHRSPVRVGTAEAVWDSLKLFRVNVRLVKAAAARPAQLEFLRDLIETLRHRCARLRDPRPVVQTHGRYHHDHVFLAPGAVTVIDLDRGRPTDPAKDAAEFLRVLRSACFKQGTGLAQADEATTTFLEEYLARVPEAGDGVSYYWLAFLMLNALGQIKKSAATDWRDDPVLDFYLREIDRAMSLEV
jgi:hypothetical protein